MFSKEGQQKCLSFKDLNMVNMNIEKFACLCVEISLTELIIGNFILNYDITLNVSVFIFSLWDVVVM